MNRIFKLSSNEGAFGPPPGAQAAYAKAAGEIHRYPESGSGTLVSALAKHHGLDPEKLVIGNGSDDILPAWSPTDPNIVYFLSNRGGAYNLWRLRLK